MTNVKVLISGLSGLGRIPDSLGRADSDGKFTIKLLQGSYYLGILIRPASGRPGPPKAGETYYFADDGQGNLRKLDITDKTKTEHGRIDLSLPEVFKQKDDRFIIEGVVLEAEGHKPYPGAMVLAKRKAEQRRPDFISEVADQDGKFSLKLPPDEIFYLVARGTLTGQGPSPGDVIGKYSTETAGGEASSVMSQESGGPPPGIIEKEGIKEIFNDSIPVSGKNGEVVSGIEIYMYKMPDRQAIKESLQGTESGAKLEAGAEINNIFFAVDSSVLDERSFEELDIWIKFLQGNTDGVEISGHTDNVGDDAYNKKLSEQRAEAVATYMKSKGIPVERIGVIGQGEEFPVDTNDTAFGRERNRRVEIRFISKP